VSNKNNKKTINTFELWKEYENIAMHFNELIIQLRSRALGGVAVITALVGFISKSDSSSDFKWELLSTAFIFLLMFWVAIFILDYFYYNKLLSGSVDAIVELEKSTKHEVSLSSQVANKAKSPKLPIFSFYGIVAFALILGFYLAHVKHIETITKTHNDYYQKK
jgi:hypothetical protein